jgi:hypothetical protein
VRSKPVPGRAGEPNRHLALIRYILSRDADERKWCTVLHGRTALMVAAMQVRCLLCLLPCLFSTALMHAHLAAVQDAAEAVGVLCDAQPWSVAWRDDRGRSAAHWAAARGASDALEALLARGADVRVRDADGATAGELLPRITRPPVLRQWEAERRGAAGERRWDYTAVMEATTFRCVCSAAYVLAGACGLLC